MSRLLLVALLGCLTGCATPAIDEADSGTRGGRHSYARKVEGKPGFVLSPYGERRALIDVRGFPRGTEVTDPWTNRVFLVP